MTVLQVLLGSSSSPLDLTRSRELLLFRNAELFDGSCVTCSGPVRIDVETGTISIRTRSAPNGSGGLDHQLLTLDT